MNCCLNRRVSKITGGGAEANFWHKANRSMCLAIRVAQSLLFLGDDFLAGGFAGCLVGKGLPRGKSALSLVRKAASILRLASLAA
jgi:hypothetical protein